MVEAEVAEEHVEVVKVVRGCYDAKISEKDTIHEEDMDWYVLHY